MALLAHAYGLVEEDPLSPYYYFYRQASGKTTAITSSRSRSGQILIYREILDGMIYRAVSICSSGGDDEE
ncbi:hypothetical protein QLX08_002366 [Tetragonisca angustula]|uniref:Uncharacterized protein n=1 Tax=Tetragonisca angustula TaxID=166442 RepID=A0AAW1ACZ6_9HYME